MFFFLLLFSVNDLSPSPSLLPCPSLYVPYPPTSSIPSVALSLHPSSHFPLPLPHPPSHYSSPFTSSAFFPPHLSPYIFFLLPTTPTPLSLPISLLPFPLRDVMIRRASGSEKEWVVMINARGCGDAEDHNAVRANWWQHYHDYRSASGTLHVLRSYNGVLKAAIRCTLPP